MSKSSYEFEGKYVQVREAGSDRLVEERFYNAEGQLDRGGDLPAVIVYGKKSQEPLHLAWYREAKIHRDGDKPAIIHKTPNLNSISFEWWQDNQRHRDSDLPARVTKRLDSNLTQVEKFYRFGELSRNKDMGPAVILYNAASGASKSREYWEFGTRVQAPRKRKTDPKPSS